MTVYFQAFEIAAAVAVVEPVFIRLDKACVSCQSNSVLPKP